MKTAASHFGATSAARSALEQLGEGPRTMEHREGEGPSTTAQGLAQVADEAQGFPGPTGVGAAAQALTGEGERAPSVAHPDAGVFGVGRKGGVVGAAGGGATKFATELARVVAADDARTLNDAPDDSMSEGPVIEQGLFEDELVEAGEDGDGEAEVVLETVPVTTMTTSVESAPAVATEFEGAAPAWSQTQEGASAPRGSVDRTHVSAHPVDGVTAVQALSAPAAPVQGAEAADHSAAPAVLAVLAEDVGQDPSPVVGRSSVNPAREGFQDVVGPRTAGNPFTPGARPTPPDQRPARPSVVSASSTLVTRASEPLKASVPSKTAEATATLEALASPAVPATLEVPAALEVPATLEIPATFAPPATLAPSTFETPATPEAFAAFATPATLAPSTFETPATPDALATSAAPATFTTAATLKTPVGLETLATAEAPETLAPSVPVSRASASSSPPLAGATKLPPSVVTAAPSYRTTLGELQTPRSGAASSLSASVLTRTKRSEPGVALTPAGTPPSQAPTTSTVDVQITESSAFPTASSGPVQAPPPGAASKDRARSPFALPVPERSRGQGQAGASNSTGKTHGHGPLPSTPNAPSGAPVDRSGVAAEPVAVAQAVVDASAPLASLQKPVSVATAKAPAQFSPKATVPTVARALAPAPTIAAVATPVVSPAIAGTMQSVSSTQGPTTLGDLVATPVASALATTPSVSVPSAIAAAGPKKEASSPSVGHRRELASGHPLGPPTMAAVFAGASTEPASPSPAAKTTSQTLEVEHAARHRPVQSPASSAAPRKLSRGQRRAASPRGPASMVAASPPTAEAARLSPPSAPDAVQVASPASVTTAAPHGRVKLPSLIPADHGLAVASSQRFASPAPHPTSPVDTNTPPPATAAPLPGLESRRVRAAVLDLVQRFVPESSVAKSASRKGIDTASTADKDESTSARRAPMLVNGGMLSSERPLFMAAPPANSAELPARSPVAAETAPVGHRRSLREESTTGSLRRAAAPAVAETVHAGFPAALATLAPEPSSSPRAPKPAGEVTARISEASKSPLSALASLVAAEPVEGARVERSTASPLPPATHEALASRPPTPTSGPAPAPAASHELRAADLALPASATAPRALMDQAAADPSLHAAAIGNNAHLRLETSNAGTLSLHLHVRDGVADLEVEGAGARSLDLRPQEIRRALAGEGIALGRFETRTSEAEPFRGPDGAVSQASGGSSTSSNGNSSSSGNGSDSVPPPPTENQRGAAASFASNNGSSSSFSEGRRSWNSDGSDGRERDPRAGSDAGQSSSTPSGSGPRRRRGFHVMA